MQGDGELARSIEILTKHLSGRRTTEHQERLRACAEAVIEPVREFVVKPAGERAQGMDEFCAVLLTRVDEFEAALARPSAQ